MLGGQARLLRSPGSGPRSLGGGDKKAYRRLARDHHPDANSHDSGAEERFKELTEAYEVLSNPGPTGLRYLRSPGPARIRAGYLLVTRSGASRTSSRLSSATAGRAPLAPSLGAPASPRASRGGDVEVEVEVAFARRLRGRPGSEGTDRQGCAVCDGIGGTNPTSAVRVGVRGGEDGAESLLGQMVSTQTCSTCGGRGRVIEVLCENCRGSGRVSEVEDAKVGCLRASRTACACGSRARATPGSRARRPGTCT